MLLWISVPVLAATVDVCSACAHTTIGRGIAAAGAGGTVRVGAGTYDESLAIEDDVTLIGAGSGSTFLRSSRSTEIIHAGLAPDYGVTLDVTIAGFTLEPPSEDGISLLNTNAHLTDLRAEGFSGAAVRLLLNGVDPVSLSVDESAFAHNTYGIAASASHFDYITVHVSESLFANHVGRAISASGTAAEVVDCLFEQNTSSDGGAVLLRADEWVVLEGNTFLGNTAVSYGGAVVAEAGLGISLERNRFCANEAAQGGAVLAWGGVIANGNIFVDNIATTSGGALHTSSGPSIENNTFVGGYAPMGGSVFSEGSLTFRNNIVAYTSEYGLYGTGGSATIAYNDFWEVAPDAVGGTWPAADATNFAVDPMFVSYVAGGCEELDLGLLPGSLLWDAGDPSTKESDGTVADIGATGGTNRAEGTKRWYRDADGDGYGAPDDVTYGPTRPTGYSANRSDCDDADALVNPHAAEICDGRDQDCDGTIDEGAGAIWRPDADGDGFQSPESVEACEPPEGWEADAGGPYDCDDADPGVFPGATDIAEDGIDQDCDGEDAETIEPPDTDIDTGRGSTKGCDSGGGPTWALLAGLMAIRARRPGRWANSRRVPAPGAG